MEIMNIDIEDLEADIVGRISSIERLLFDVSESGKVSTVSTYDIFVAAMITRILVSYFEQTHKPEWELAQQAFGALYGDVEALAGIAARNQPGDFE